MNSIVETWADAMFRASRQGGVALALAWVVCRALPKLPPAVKCWVWRLAYAKVLVALVWSAPLELPLLRAPATITPIAAAEPAARARGVALPVVPDATASDDTDTSDPSSARPRTATAASALTAEAPATSSIDPLTIRSILLTVWSIGVSFYSIRLIVGWRAAVRLRRHSRPLADGHLADAGAALCRHYGIARPPPLHAADLPGGPLLMGIIRPVILLPDAWLRHDRPAPPGHLRLMLAHELAHLRRRDLWWNWLAAACHGLLFFHPLAWLAAREYAMAQETACDAAALAATRARPADYGSMLVSAVARAREVAARSKRTFLPTLPPVAAAGVAESRATLERRLTAMQHLPLWTRRRAALAGAVLALAGAAGLVPWRVVAQQRQQEQSPPAKENSDAPAPKEAAPDTGARDGGADETTTRVFQLRRTRAADAEGLVKLAAKRVDDAALKQPFTTAYDERANALIVSGPAATVRALAKVVGEVDGAPADEKPGKAEGGGGSAYGAGTARPGYDPTAGAASPYGRPAGRGQPGYPGLSGSVSGPPGAAGEGAPGGFPGGYGGVPANPPGGDFPGAPRGGGPAQVVRRGRLTSATAQVRTPIAGTVAEVHVKEGDRVKKGQPLVTLNDRKLVAAAEAAAARLRAAEVVVQRQQELVKQNLTPREELEQAKAALEEARATLALARQELGEGQITAPIDGVVADVGALPGAVLTKGGPLLTVVEVDALKAEFDVPPDFLDRLQVGQELKIQRVPASRLEPFTGKVSFISPKVEPNTGTVRVKAQVDNARGQLRPGMSIQVFVPAPDGEEGGAAAPGGAGRP